MEKEDFIVSSIHSVDINNIWEQAKKLIENKIAGVSFDVWITTIEPVELKGNCLILATPSSSSKKVLKNNYKNQITACLNEVHNAITSVEFVIGSAEEELKEIEIEPQVVEEKQELSSSNFNPKYTFDNFVVGASNQFVAAAAKAVAQNPGGKWNPLFIYGGVGLGKTHLLHAIGSYISEHEPNKKVVYVTCRNFADDLLAYIRDSKKTATADFRAKYRSADVLIIDDIQGIINRTAVQNEFFDTFNDLHQAGKQIIIASDKPPKDINPLEERLRSRFEWGMLADIGIPDLDTKVAILSKKAQMEHYNVSRDVLEFIASAQTTNIRELEGMLARTVFLASLKGESIASLDIAKEALKDIAVQDEAEIDAGKIVDNVCKFFNIKKDEILARKRTKEVALARQVAMYLISDMLGTPYESIGNIFGKDHSTAIYAKNKIIEDMQKNKKLATDVNDIKQMIKGK